MQLIAVFFTITVATGVLLIMIYSPNVKRELTTLSQNYINDLALAYGSTLDNEIKKADGDSTYALKTDALSLKLDGVGIKGIESSYVYVTDETGKMLYHKDGSKIGKSVENKVVKQVIADLQAGKEVQNGVVSYQYQGKTKYASIYVSTYKEFVLVVSADEGDVLKPIEEINLLGGVGILVSVLVCGAVGLMFASLIVKPITRMTDVTQRLAEMDFTDDGQGEKMRRRKDEIGSMSRALNNLRMELVRVVAGIREQSTLLLHTSENLNASAAETSATMEQLECAVGEIAQGATAQASDTQHATEKVILMGEMVEETDHKVMELVAYAQQMKKSGADATEILNCLTQVNEQAEQYIQVIAQQTATTNESAQKIHEAASMITEIADETNLLSLNASIEAARAGEQGRGFAVVAAQIQKLAEQSNESAHQIGEIITTLMEDSQKAVSIMEDVKEIMLKQSEHVERTKEAFLEIQSGVERSIGGMNEISAKTQQMDDARAGVVDIVQNLSAIAQENAASTEETSASVTEVSAISGELSEESKRLEEISRNMEEGMAVFKI